MAKITSGVTFIPNGSPNTFKAGDGYEFTELQAVTDCKIDRIDAANGFKCNNIEGMILPSGVVLKLRAESFSLRSGSVLAYYAKTIDKSAKAQ